MKKLVAAIAALTVLGAGQATAEVTSYVGVAYTGFQYEEDLAGLPLNQSSVEFDVSAFTLKGGFQLNDYLALEARVGFGISDDSETLTGSTSVKSGLELNNYLGAYIKAGLPLGEVFYPYVMAGVTRFDFEASATNLNNGFSARGDDSDNDVSFGVGADIRLGEHHTVNAEYANFYDKDSVEIDGFSLGYTYRF